MNTENTAYAEPEVATDLDDMEDGTEVSQEADSRETVSVAPAIIPSKEELLDICNDIKTGIDFNVDVKPVVFRFKTSKDENGVEVKRDALELPIPYPNVQGIVDILEKGSTEEGKKGLELLMDAVESVVTGQARSLISDNWELNATNMPVDKLSWDFIANMPKPERMGGGIAKEVWEDFGKDYLKTMPEVTGKTIEQVTQAAKLLVGKMSAVKTNVPVLNLLVEQLTIYIEHSTRAEEFEPCVSFLVDKADKLLHTTPEELLANL